MAVHDLHARTDPLVAHSGPDPHRVVLIWQGERNHDGRLGFLYWPVMGTLLEGFRHSACQVRAGLGFSLAYHEHLRNLSRGDVFIWVGQNGIYSQPWLALRRRGIYRVWFQTEPTHQYGLDRRQVEEIWDFSWHNMEAVRRRAFPPKVRFIPPGYLRAASPPSIGGTNTKLLFLGAIDDARRRPCWEELKRLLGADLQQTYAAWNASKLSVILSQHEFFLNLHKGCEKRHAPVTFRAALLLSAGKLILSERAHHKDEHAYQGLIFFVNQRDIPAAYHELRARSGRGAIRRAILSNFSKTFAPRALFETAGVYRDWNLTVLRRLREGP